LIAVPINFRLVGTEIQYIVENCGAKALIVQDELLDSVESVRVAVSILADRFILFGHGRVRAGFHPYEELIANARDTAPPVEVCAEDPWTLMYTSGTTGKPKGTIRGHRGSAMLSLVTDAEMGLTRHDSALLAMAPFTAARASILSISCTQWPRTLPRSPPWYRRITS